MLVCINRALIFVLWCILSTAVIVTSIGCHSLYFFPYNCYPLLLFQSSVARLLDADDGANSFLMLIRWRHICLLLIHHGGRLINETCCLNCHNPWLIVTVEYRTDANTNKTTNLSPFVQPSAYTDIQNVNWK